MSNLAEVKEILERQGDAFENYVKRVDALEKELVKGNRPGLFGGSESKGDAEYKAGFLNYLRSGREAEVKSMSSGVDPSGGYLLPKVIDSLITKALRELSPMRQLARVIPVTTADFNMLHSAGGTGYAWVGETQARPETDTPTLRNIAPPLGEIYANPGCTQRLLDDPGFDLESWLTDEVSEAFAEGEGAGFITGNGIEKPRGITTYDMSTDVDGTRSENAWQYIVTGTSGGFPASNPVDKLLALVYAVKPRYRQNARWLMSSSTLEVVRKFKDGQGQLLWQPSLQAGEPSMLLGFPVFEDENMPVIAANSFSIAFGNFQRGYVILDRNSATLRDPYSNKPYVHFYTTKRIGGGARDLRAIKFLKFGTA
jgi:HK97 family phage major capsid protein